MFVSLISNLEHLLQYDSQLAGFKKTRTIPLMVTESTQIKLSD